MRPGVEEEEKSQKALLWLVAVAVFMETLDATIVNTALPAMASSLGESPLRMYAIILAYSLTLAVLIPASGWLADRFGIRAVFCGAIAFFGLGSLACAGSQSLAQLVGARFFQGIGGSMMIPVGRLAILRTFSNERYVKAISFVAVPGLLGPLVGPTLGGMIVETASWHWIFLVNIPIAILGFLASRKWMPDLKAELRARFDARGYAMLAVSMLAMSLALDGLSELGLPQVTVLLLAFVSFVSLVVYGLHAARCPYALFPLKLFSVASYRVGLLGNMFGRIGSGGMPFLVPLYLQIGLGLSPSRAGVLMIPVAITSIAAKPFAPGIIARLSYRRLLIWNTFLIGACIMSFAIAGQNYPLWLVGAQLAFFGFVNALQFTAMNTVTLKDMPASVASAGNSLYSMVQMLSISFGTAAAGALTSSFNARLGNQLGAFHATFVCMGFVSFASAAIFWQLKERT